MAASPDVAHDEQARGPNRSGTPSGIYLGFEGGIASLRSGARERGRIGFGSTLGARAGVAFWDQLAFNVAGGGLWFADKEPFSELVVDCQTVSGVTVGCGDPTNQQSRVTGGFLSLETGYQRRFVASRSISLLPALMLGYAQRLGKLKRGVQCDGCRQVPIQDIDTSGAYLAPEFRVTLSQSGAFALSLRSEWYLTGDLTQRTLLAFELGMP
ncbi:MAG TPA: hypothetical protein VGI10_14890 [Polyangiaceae bacterium]